MNQSGAWKTTLFIPCHTVISTILPPLDTTQYFLESKHPPAWRVHQLLYMLLIYLRIPRPKSFTRLPKYGLKGGANPTVAEDQIIPNPSTSKSHPDIMP